MAVTSFNIHTTVDEVLPLGSDALPPPHFVLCVQVGQTLAQDIAGKNVLVNGVTWGSLGAGAAAVIAKHANLLLLGGRSMSSLQKTIDEIHKETPQAELRPFIFDMSTLEGARKAAEEVKSFNVPIHVVIHSAGIMACPYSKTTDGIEHHMAINHFAPFLFTSLIFPILASSGTPSSPSRIVNISSSGHQFAPLQDDVNFHDGSTYEKWKGYGQSKTSNILFANEIARRAKESGVNVLAYSVDPGTILTTGLGEFLTQEDWDSAKDKDGNYVWKDVKSAECGAATYVIAAFDPSIVPYSGAYLENGDIGEQSRAEHARSESEGKRLWEISERLTGQKFVI